MPSSSIGFHPVPPQCSQDIVLSTTLEMTVNHNPLAQFPKAHIVLQSKIGQKKNDQKMVGELSLQD
jgi:hypothetical protein